MEATTTIKTFASTVKGATGVTVNHRVTGAADGVKEIFSTIRRADVSLGYVNYGRDGNRCQIFFEPFTATTTKEKKAIVAVVLGDLDELLTPARNG